MTAVAGALTLDDLAEEWDLAAQPVLDQSSADGAGLAGRWSRDGYVILRDFMPANLIDSYCRAWQQENQHRPMGWPYDVPYMHVPALRDLCCHRELAQVLAALIGEPMGVHLNLSGWRSTTRDWHLDQYLNPPFVGGWYAAVWMALDDIHPDSGPFEYIPGSHRLFRPLSQDKVRAALGDDGNGPDWPNASERLLTPLFEQAITERGLIPQQFIANKGDILIWHSCLLHRGSTPHDPTRERRAVISHLSGVHHRPDMPHHAEPHGAGWFFPIDQGGHR